MYINSGDDELIVSTFGTTTSSSFFSLGGECISCVLCHAYDAKVWMVSRCDEIFGMKIFC